MQPPADLERALLDRRALIALAGLALASCRDEPKQPPAPPPPPPPAAIDAAARPDARAAIDRAAGWLAAFPAEELRFDAAIGLAAIRARVDGEALRRAEALARQAADRDPDHPLRRAFDPGFRVAAGSAAGWAVPAAGEPRVNVNRVVGEALHCAEHGLRDATLAYATGPMRDEGGFHTTHALWALTIARDQGCLDPARFATLAAPLVAELRAAQPAAPEPAVLAADLFAERLLMLRLAGERDPALDAWAAALIAAQGEDGGFGTAGPDDPPYFRYHATMMAAWALAAGLAP